MTRDMPEPFDLPSLDSCQKRFLWAHKESDLGPRAFVGLVLQVGGAEKSPARHVVTKVLYRLSASESTSHNHRGGWKRQDTCTA